jgi:hypothetical protein
VLPKRLPVLPAAPLHHQSRLDFALDEQGAPDPPEIVWTEVGPAVVSRVGVQALASRSDPPPDRTNKPVGYTIKNLRR